MTKTARYLQMIYAHYSSVSVNQDDDIILGGLICSLKIRIIRNVSVNSFAIILKSLIINTEFQKLISENYHFLDFATMNEIHRKSNRNKHQAGYNIEIILQERKRFFKYIRTLY